MTPGLAVSGLTVVRGGRTLLEDVSFTGSFGAVTAVLGPNGAGKSTALKAIVGLMPHQGRVTLGGELAGGWSAVERARKLGYVPQRSELSAPLPVREVVAHARYAHDAWGRVGASAASAGAIDAALRQTGATELAHRSYLSLSQGERQRVLIARALATGARTLLLDEPAAALDVQHALKLYALLRELASQGHCVVVALHELQDALAWTDHAVLLDKGSLVVQAATDVLFRSGAIEAVFGVRLVRDAAFAFRLIEAPDTGEHRS